MPREHAKSWGAWGSARFWAHGKKVGLVPKLVWRVKLVAETDLTRIERDEHAGLADLGLRLTEMKQLTAALQAEIVPAQVAVVGERGGSCASCRHKLASTGARHGRGARRHAGDSARLLPPTP